MTNVDKPPVGVRCPKKDPNRDYECVYSAGHPGRCCMQRRSDIAAGEYVTWLYKWKRFAKWASFDESETVTDGQS